MATPLYVVQELARIRESAATNMLDRSRVEQLVINSRAAEWLDKASDSQYIEALNDMGRADSNEFLDDSPRKPRPSDDEGYDDDEEEEDDEPETYRDRVYFGFEDENDEEDDESAF